jgi:hypothetical protein
MKDSRPRELGLLFRERLGSLLLSPWKERRILLMNDHMIQSPPS